MVGRGPNSGAYAMNETLEEADGKRAAESRPWGAFTVIDQGADYKVKVIQVLPHQRLSYQRHRCRIEHWVIVRGTGKAVIDGSETAINPGSMLTIPPEVPHRVANLGDDELIIVEIQRGSYLSEDDIIRIDDDYGR
jgi:mannose-6-phosphate isomerase